MYTYQLLGAAAVALIMAGSPSFAGTVNDYTDVGSFLGNDCTGGGKDSTWGDPSNPFASTSGSIGTGACALEGSAAILRINFADDGSFTLSSDAEFNLAFPTIDGKEFSFDFGTDSDPATGGTWTYTPDDAEDPGITGFVTKGGPNFRVFLKDGPAFKGVGDIADFLTPTDGKKTFGLSHITWFDSVFDSVAPIPLPAGVWLLGAGLVGLIGIGRRRARV